jgi:hypothetical protein
VQWQHPDMVCMSMSKIDTYDCCVRH